jgi:drug/metabolite transporter (DMT)-like permease
MDNKNRSIVEMLICATLWSTAGIFIKLIPWNALAITGMRSLIAGLTILVYIQAKRYRIVVKKRTVVPAIIMAAVYICFVMANKLTTAANAIVLQFTSPLFIVIFSAIFYHKKIKKADLIAVLVTFGGIALFFFDQLKPGYLLGNIVAIVAGMFMAFMYMAMGDIKGEEKFSAAFMGQMFAFLGGLPAIIITKPEFSGMPLLYIALLGVFQLGIAYTLYTRASEYCPPLACCLLGAVEPLLNPVWVAIFDGEVPGVFALIGGVIVITAVTVWCIVSGKEDKEKVPANA